MSPTINGICGITVAYLSIPLTLVYFVRKRRDVPFNWMFVCFGVFIVACGAATHALEIWNLWHAPYWLAGLVKAITAAASVPTAVLLVHLVPKPLALPSPEVVIRANSALEKEVRERRDAQLALQEREGRIQSLNEDLTRRAVELEALNKELEAFSYSVSHDLRAHCATFMASRGSFSKSLRLAWRRSRCTISSTSPVRRGTWATWVDDLLNLSRLGRTVLTRKPVGLNNVLREVLHEISSGVTTDQEIEWRIRDLPVAECDRGLITRWFSPICSRTPSRSRARACGD